MRKKVLNCAIALFMISSIAWGQERTISGKVTSTEDGSSLPGVNVVLKGTTNGTVTDADGSYSLSIPQGGGSLLFSFIGLSTQEVVIGNRSVVDVSLALDVTQLSEVVVTALGIERDKSSLGYATQQVSEENLRFARETNLGTSLAGKIAGVQIVSGSGAKFGAPAIRIRGARGLSPSDPLYVLDGIVIDDPSSINLDNVQNVNVLKGANASALYGSRARDGVIVLTSKSGKKTEAVNINFNQTSTWENVYVLPEYQDEYGGGYSQTFPTFNYDPTVHNPGLAGLDGMPMTEFYADESWGPKMNGQMVAQWDAFTQGTEGYGKARPWSPNPDNVKNYFRTGMSNITSVNIGKSGELYSFNSTITNSSRTGVMENTSQDKLFFNVNFTGQLTDKLELKAAANYNKINTFGNLFEGYNSLGSNINQWFQRQLDMDLLKKYYRLPDGSYTSWNINSPSDPTPLYWDNPYTTVHANSNEVNKEIYSAKFALSYEIIEGLKVSAQGTRAAENGHGTVQVASGTLNLAGFSTYSYSQNEDNFQGMLAFDKRIGDNFSVVANAGFNLRNNQIDSWSLGTSGGLSVPNLFNISASVDPALNTNFSSKYKVNSYFMQASIGYRDFLYLDATFREDYDSRLPNGKNAYSYPSVSGSFVFSELTSLNWLSFGKLRASYAEVGGEIGDYSTPGRSYFTQPAYILGIPYNGNAITSVPNNLIDPSLRAATTSAIEAGFELGFLDNRIRAEFSTYKYNNDNELLSITIPSSSGGSGFLTNSVKSTTKGWELSISGTPIKDAKGLTWDVNFNISQNTQIIDELGFGLNAFPLANGFRGTSTSGGWGSPQALARVGEEWGVITGRKFRTDADGNRVVNASGLPLYDTNQDLGHILPDFTGGIVNRFSYKNFDLAVSIDYQIGGEFLSISRMFGAYSGLAAETVGNNDKGNPRRDPVAEGGGLSFGGVFADGTPNNIYVETDEYYKSLFALHEAWIYDATFVKVREARLGYTFPSSLIGDITWLKGASIAFVANNPFLLYSKIDGYDPSEIGGDTVEARNNGSWVESGNLPGTRSFGFDLKLKF